MDITRLTTGRVSSNTYIVTDNDRDCIIIDCDDGLKIKNFLESKGLLCKALLLTHAHFDHCNGAACLQKNGAKVYLHEADRPLLKSGGNLAAAMGQKFNEFIPDVSVNDGDTFNVCGFDVKVIHTPGHTVGSVCYIINDEVIFSGDTLFYLSVGRTDFPTGNQAQLSSSIKDKLFVLDKDYKIYPGHDRPTHLFFERENNFYV